MERNKTELPKKDSNKRYGYLPNKSKMMKRKKDVDKKEIKSRKHEEIKKETIEKKKEGENEAHIIIWNGAPRVHDGPEQLRIKA